MFNTCLNVISKCTFNLTIETFLDMYANLLNMTVYHLARGQEVRQVAGPSQEETGEPTENKDKENMQTQNHKTHFNSNFYFIHVGRGYN